MSIRDHFNQTTNLIYLALPRIVVGYYFLRVGMRKVNAETLSGHPLAEQLTRLTAMDPFSWHRDFIMGVVVPNSQLFAWLVAFGELAIGVSLVLGCLVRVSSAFGAFHNFNILLAVGIPNGGAQIGVNLMFVVMQLMFLFSSPGRVLGLDSILKKHFPRSWLF